LRIGRVDRAIDCYRKSLKALENSRVRALLGWCYLQTEDYRAALEQYRLAYKAQPRYDIALTLASLEFHLGDKDTGLDVLKRVQGVRDVLDVRLLRELEKLEAKLGLQPNK
jgi:tetratricopeptide (TPR) repeat protein